MIAADALAMAVALDPDIIRRSESHHVGIELDGALTRGATVVDWENCMGRTANARIVLDVDRAKAYALGVSFDRIGDALGNTFGSTYIDDFPSGGRMRRVMIAADASSRMTEADLMNLSVRNLAGQMVPLSSVASLHWTTGPSVLTRYNGSPS